MQELAQLVLDGRLLIGYALANNISLSEQVLRDLGGAEATALALDQAKREGFIVSLHEASTAVSITLAELRAVSSRNARLRPLVDSALTLLTFAAANGKTVDDETRKVLLASDAAVSGRIATVEQEQAFLKAYEDLTKSLAPITVETLDSSKTISVVEAWRTRRTRNFAGWRPGRYVSAGIFAFMLVSTGIVLAYYFVGASAIEKYESLLDIERSLGKEARTAEQGVLVSERALSDFISRTDSNNTATGEEAALLNAVVERKSNHSSLIEQRKNVLIELNAISSRLGRWARQPCNGHRFSPFRIALCAEVDRTEGATEHTVGKSDGRERADSSATPGGTTTGDTSSVQTSIRDGAAIDIAAAKTVVSRLNDVYLPLLLGLLGGHSYILRRMSQEIVDRSFAAGAAFNHFVRAGLGALAGLASTWLFTPDTVNGTSLKALPSWALAFVAGYGIELVFAFMDRIIAAFTGPKQ